jgi:hypothetical protein
MTNQTPDNIADAYVAAFLSGNHFKTIDLKESSAHLKLDAQAVATIAIALREALITQLTAPPAQVKP